MQQIQPSVSQLKMAVTELFKAVNCALRNERDDAEQYIERAETLLCLESSSAVRAESIPPNATANRPLRSGLAPWQIRKVTAHIESNLGARVSTQDLATVAGLSPFHFSRVFRDSFGDSPHKYLSRRRIECSQGIMLTTNASLADIALGCGLVDQAHFGKLFRRLVGKSPGAWRRARINQEGAPAPSLSTLPVTAGAR